MIEALTPIAQTAPDKLCYSPDTPEDVKPAKSPTLHFGLRRTPDADSAAKKIVERLPRLNDRSITGEATQTNSLKSKRGVRDGSTFQITDLQKSPASPKLSANKRYE